MEKYEDACMFCGQMAAADEFESQEDADREASLNCTCKEGVDWRNRQEGIQKAKANIDALFGEYCGEYKPFYPVAEEILRSMKDAVSVLADHKIDKIRISFPKGDSALLTATATGSIKVKRSVPISFELKD